MLSQDVETSQVGGTAALQEATLAAYIHAALRNERHSPEILPYPVTLIDDVIVQIDHKTLRVAELEAASAADGGAAVAATMLPFRPEDLLRLELQRMRFALVELLRVRLRKIERIARAIAHDREGFEGVLSENEMTVALRLAQLTQNAVLLGGLHRAPQELQLLVPNLPHAEGREILPVQDLSKHVFVLVEEDLGTVELSAGVEEVVRKGDIYLVQYALFKRFILEGRATLV